MVRGLLRSLVVLLLPLTAVSAVAAQGDGRTYYVLGVFAHADGAYEDAEGNLLRAIEREPDNPKYLHQLGKTYLAMQAYGEAETYLSQAWEIEPGLPELRYDLATLRFSQRDFERAAGLYAEVLKEDAANVLATYNAGISHFRQQEYEPALEYLLRAGELSTSTRANAHYYAGLCYQRLGRIEEAIEKLEDVLANAPSESLRRSAENALWAIKAQARADRRFRFFGKLGMGYDDNVRLAPDDEDIGADRGDAFLSGYISGRYDLVRSQQFTLGAGYNHYQTLYRDLDEFDLIGATPNLYARYRVGAVTLGLRYLPSFYWLDQEKYLIRHELRPAVLWRVRKNLAWALAYAYQDENHQQDNGRDGEAHVASLDLVYNYGGRKSYLQGGGAFKSKSTDSPDQEFDQWTARAGLAYELGPGFAIGLKGRYYRKEYDNVDSDFGVRREDDHYEGALSLEHRFLTDVLGVVAEFSYSKNDSNIRPFDYDRKIATLSLTATY